MFRYAPVWSVQVAGLPNSVERELKIGLLKILANSVHSAPVIVVVGGSHDIAESRQLFGQIHNLRPAAGPPVREDHHRKLCGAGGDWAVQGDLSKKGREILIRRGGRSGRIPNRHLQSAWIVGAASWAGDIGENLQACIQRPAR